MLRCATTVLAAAAAAAAAAAPPHPSGRALPLLDLTARAIARPGRSGAVHYNPAAAARSSLAAAAGLRGLTDSSLWPAAVTETHAAVGGWKLLGTNAAAMSPDCPYLNHGPGDSLAACEAACANLGACNVLNFNPAISDCVLRACDNPLAPTLSPQKGYSVYGAAKAALALDPATFAFAPVGFAGAVLQSAMRRYGSIMFVYGNGSAAAASGGVHAVGAPLAGGGQLVVDAVNGLTINVTSADEELREGVDESYTLAVEGDAGRAGPPYASVLTARTVFGALRGLETLAQLVQWNASNGAYSIMTTLVTDAPRFPFRGVLVDLARHFIPLSQLRAVVDAMAAVKLNALHLHLSDDQSFPLVRVRVRGAGRAERGGGGGGPGA